MTVRLAVLGAGRIGANHAEIVARRVPGAELAVVADPVPGAAERLAAELDVPAWTTDTAEALRRDDVDAIVIAAPARSHTDLVVEAARAGKHVFVEKPMAITLADADRAVEAAANAGVTLQVGFNRRFAPGFAAARAAVDEGRIGTPHLLRSVTRDPGPYGGDPSRTPPWTIFLETLIHDFDALCFLNPGREPLRVHAVADALIRPDAKADGFLDTAVVTVTFDGGAIGVAEASFSALYGYDVRGEVFGSAGMATVGSAAATDLAIHDASGIHVDTARRDTDLLRSSYIAEFAAFVDAVRAGTGAVVDGHDARRALTVALAAIESVRTGASVEVAS